MADAPRKDWLDAATFPLLFAWGFGAYLLFFKGPAANGTHLAYRVAVFSIGLVGSLVVIALKAARDRRRGS